MKTPYTIAILFFIYLSNIISAQSPYWQWAKSAGGDNHVHPVNGNWNTSYNISADGNGNSYITGYFNDTTITFGSTTLTNHGGQEGFVVKYDATGNVIWAKSLGIVNFGFGVSTISADNNGNAYVSGVFADTIIFGGDTVINPGIVKYDAIGNVIWAKAGVGGGPISTDANGNVYLTGGYDGTITFGSDTLSGSSNAVFLLKLDSSGNVLWAKNVGSAEPYTFQVVFYGICTDDNGNLYSIGTYTDTITFGSITLTGSGSENVFVVKYDSTGSVIWAKSVDGGNEAAYGFGITSDGNGNAYISGGFSSSTITFDSVTLYNNALYGEDNVFIARYDAAGNVVWAESAGGIYSADGFGTSADGSGNIYVTGYFESPTITFGSYTLTNSNSDNVFVVKYDSSGNVIWAQSAGGTGTSNAWSISTDANGNAYITGDFTAPTITFGSITLTYAGTGVYGAIFIAKIATCILPLSPTNTTATSAQTLCAGNSATLTATGTGTLGWYSSASGGIYLGGGSSFATSALTSSTPFYVQDSTCAASSRTAITVTVHPKPNPIITPLGGDTLSTDTFAIYQWLLNGTAINAATQQLYKATASGNYQVAVTDTNGCTDTSVIYVLCILPPPPVNTSAIPAQTVCAGNNTILTATGTGILGWYNADSGGSYFGGGPSLETFPLTATTTFYVQDSTCGVSARTAVTVTMYPKPNPVITQLGIDTLTTSTFATYQWLVNGQAISNATEQSYTATASGNYQVAVTDTNGCIDTSAIYVLCILPLPPSNTTATAAQTVCAGNNTILTATGAGTLSWHSADSGGSYLGGGTSFATSALTSSTTFYVQDSTCAASTRTAINVTVHPKPNSVITQLGIDTLTTSTFATYQWLVNGQAISNATEQSYRATMNSNYQVAVTDTNGCTDTSGVYNLTTLGIVVINEPGNISLYPNPSNGSIYFNGVKSGYTIEVYDLLGEIIYIAKTTSDNYCVTISGQAKGIYFYRVMANNTIIQQGKIIVE